MGRGFLGALAKWTNYTILPTPTLKAIRYLNSILQNKPCDDLTFRGCPSLPNDFVHVCVNEAFVSHSSFSLKLGERFAILINREGNLEVLSFNA